MPKSLRKHLISVVSISFSNSAVRVHVSQAYRKIEMTKDRISLTLELSAMMAYFTFTCVYRLYHFGLRGKMEMFVCCTSECLGRRDVVQKQCLFDSVNPGLPGASSCFSATESCVICTLSWVLDWQSCEVSKTFDPLLLDMTLDALCSYHFSDLGVGDHVSSGLVDSFP